MATTRDQNGRKRASKWDTPAPNAGSATEAAREAARKLNAMLAAKGKLTTNSTPPLLPPKPKSTAGTNGSSASVSSLFTEEIEINDSPRRLLLCQSNVQFEINKYSGAVIMIKGQYIAPSEKGNMTGQRPLYLLIQSPFKDKVNLAVQRIKGIMNGEDPFSPPAFPPQMLQSGQTSTLPSGMYYVQEKVFIGLDKVHPEFNLREKIVGPGESYFQHITKETGAKVCLRGRGSGFMEPTSGREAFEALYVYISHTNYAGLGSAKKLVENLVQTVHTAYQQFLMQQPSNSYYPNYAGYPSQNTGPPQNHPAAMCNMPPVSGYGPPPHSGAPQPPHSYPSYQYPLPNRPPPHYNQQSQPVANPTIPHGPPMQPHSMNLNPALRHEGPRPLMDQHPSFEGPQSSPKRSSTLYTPDSPTQPCPSPTQSTFSSDDKPSVSDSSDSDNEVKLKKPDEKLSEQSKPGKRRFTEAPATKSTSQTAPEFVLLEKRSVSSLDQQSTQCHTPGDDARGDLMAPPVLPAPKLKTSNGNVKKDTADSLPGFKMPLMPISKVLSGAKKSLSGPPLALSKLPEKKRKMEEANEEKKSTGIALLGSYDDGDSSDED